VEEVDRIKKVSIWIFIVPVVILNLCLLISVNSHLFQYTIFRVDPIGQSGFTIPYIDGGVSISRTARTYPTYLLFKPGMIVTAILLIQYWVANNRLFKKINDEIKNKSFLIFGIGSAIFLIIHSIFLGINFEIDSFLLGQIEKFLRRFVLLSFIIFEIIAQALLVTNIIKIKEKIGSLINKKILILKIILVSILIIVAILVAPILNSSDYKYFKHALEWNYFLGVVTFYLLTSLFWKTRKPPVHTP
jgi:hypothetical protein